MSLFRFELRKLLMNKGTLLIVAVMAILFAAVGFGSSRYLVGSGEFVKAYSALGQPAIGQLNQETADQAIKSYEALKERYGDNPQMIEDAALSDPAMKFAVDYAAFADSVNEYHDGVNVLREKLAQLERSGQTNTFEYQSVKSQLNAEISLGEPQFANTMEWGNLFTNWGSFIMLFMLLVPLAFIISPVFCLEASTGMDNLILSSRNGRRKIVTAKLGAVAVTAVTIIGVYLLATFAFGFITTGNLDGFNAALRSIPDYVHAPFGFTAWQFTLVSALWVLLSGTVYSLIVAFISSRLKNQMTVLIVSLIVLFLNVAISALGTGIQASLSWLTDFGVASFALVGQVFTGYKAFNVFGFPVPYYAALLVFMAAVTALVARGMYWGQKRRTVA